MGCASSAALPFLANRGNQAAAESPRMNGKPPYELKMVNNKLKENGATNAKDVNESYVSDKMKEVVDSTAVQGVIGGVVQAKDEIFDRVAGIGESMSEKVTSVVEGAENAIESTFDKLESGAESLAEEVKSAVRPGGEAEGKDSVYAEDIDELLEALPPEEEVAAAVKTTAEEVLEKAAEEVKEEAAN